MHRGFAHLGRQYPIEQRRQRDGEIAVAAVQFNQITAEPLGLLASPGQHLAVDAAVGLGKAAFDLLIFELASVQFECLQQPVTLQNDLLPTAAADDLCAQFGCQLAGCRFPGIVQFAVVDQCDQQFAAQRGKKIDPEQATAQDLVARQTLAQARHGSADGDGSRREGVEQDALLRIVRIGHREIELVAIVPDAKFDTHPVMTRLGSVYNRVRNAEFCEILFEMGSLGGELGRVVSGVVSRERHVWRVV